MISIDMSGKRALVMGVTNRRSLGWAIAEQLHQAGATLAFSYQGERLRSELEKLTANIDDVELFQVDVTRADELQAMFDDLRERWGVLDHLVHSIAFAPKDAMLGRYVDTGRDDWVTALEVSAYSLVAVARAAEPLFQESSSMVTLTYHASQQVVPKYNVMGVAKAALEASVRYLAYDLGEKGVRVNALSAGPVKTVAARSIPGFMAMYKKAEAQSMLGRTVEHAEVGSLGLFLLSELAGGVTGETVYADVGAHHLAMSFKDG
ncbi:MAG: enoyl-ACP reductase [Acidobacteriota bacterium]